MGKQLRGVDLQIAVNLLNDAYETGQGWAPIMDFLDSEGYEFNDTIQDIIREEWEWQHGQNDLHIIFSREGETMPKLKTVKKSDNVVINFGEWFDRTYGNTYYDAEVYVGDKRYLVAYQYGYNAGDKQSIDEALAAIGYRVRTNKGDVHAPYRNIRVTVFDKKKRDLFKTTTVTCGVSEVIGEV